MTRAKSHARQGATKTNDSASTDRDAVQEVPIEDVSLDTFKSLMASSIWTQGGRRPTGGPGAHRQQHAGQPLWLRYGAATYTKPFANSAAGSELVQRWR